MKEVKEEKRKEQRQEQDVLKPRSGPSRIGTFFRSGSTGIAVVLVGITFYFLLLRLDSIRGMLKQLLGILQPVMIGGAIAYLLNPIVVKVEKFAAPHLKKKMGDRAKSLSRTLGILVAFIFGLSLVYMLIMMVVPELFESIRGLVVSLPKQVQSLIDQFSIWEERYAFFDEDGYQLLTSLVEAVENWINTDLFAQINTIMASVTSGIINIFSLALNVFVGIVVAIYLLNSKEQYGAYIQKCIYAFLGQEKGDFTMHIAKKSHETFGGFFVGKIIDSFIIGVLCFIGLTVLNIPYALIVSVIIGITNIIPVFGPYIGAVPSAILILIAEPRKGLYFIIFIIVLQQLDGNVIGPKILGDSIGITPFWILVSILIGGGFFGFIGMLIGVPVAAIILYIVDLFTQRRLKEKDISL